MKPRSSSNKIAHGLVAVSSAAVLAVYAAGYTRTQSAADKLNGEGQAAGMRSGPGGGPGGGPVGGPGGGPSRASLPAVASLAATSNPTLPAVAPTEVAPTAITPANEAAGKKAAADKTVLTASVKAAPVAVTTPDTPVVSTPAASAPVTPPVPAEDPVITAAKAAAAPPWKDGSYTGWGTCRHGDIEATVVIAEGKITSATITQCLTRYSCDIIEKLPPQVAKRQSPDVDYVSGATQSAGAFYWAVVGALGKAK